MSAANLQLQIADLVGRMCDNSLAESDVLRLNELLLDNPEAQRFYLRQLEIDAALAWRTEPIELPSELCDVTFPTRTPTVAPARGSWSLWTAASILLVAGLFYGGFAVLAWNMQPAARREVTSSPSSEAAPAPAVASRIAIVSGSEGAVWQNVPAGQSVGLGDSLPTNFRGQLATGMVEVTLTSGTTVEVVAPSTIELVSPEVMHLDRGKLTAHVPPQAIGFIVTTPTATIVDRGTEFGVEADERGSTEVHVLRGLVEARANQPQASSRLLGKNEAVRFDATTVEGTVVEANAQRFARHLSGRRAPVATMEVTSLPFAEILPGSEITTLVANGNFEDGGTEEPLGSGQFPRPDVWERNGHLFTGALPSSAFLPSACGRMVALASLDGGIQAGLYQQSVILQSDTEYVLSAYLWNFSSLPRAATANVDLNDAPGEANLRLMHDEDRASHGRFAYQRFHTRQTGTELLLRVFFDGNRTSADNYAGAYDIAWDHIAITKASRFLPPIVRDRPPAVSHLEDSESSQP